jgi:hypothetical protein
MLFFWVHYCLMDSERKKTVVTKIRRTSECMYVQITIQIIYTIYFTSVHG